MVKTLPVLAVCVAMAVWTAAAPARVWTDATGRYTVEAELVAIDGNSAVLKKPDHKLVHVVIDQLSAKDQEYLKSQEALETDRKSEETMQTWTLRNGLKVVGRVIDYGRKDVTLQRRRGKLYVNDRLFDNLPPAYRELMPHLVAHFENVPIDGKKGLDAWVLKQHGQPRTFSCEGVKLELENGDEYLIPFFAFADADLEVLQPGWHRWQAADQDRSKQEHQSFLLQSQAHAYQQDQMAKQQISMMQLQMQAYEAGLFALWEVELLPAPGQRLSPMIVVVPGRDSRMAAAEASAKYPGYVVGAVVKAERK